MKKAFPFVLLLAGIVVLASAVSACNSAGSGLSGLAPGSPSGKTTWLFIGGAVLAVLGLVGILGGSNSA
jgi:hypothetical protein